jgi:hypothetical protein
LSTGAIFMVWFFTVKQGIGARNFDGMVSTER